MSKTTVLERLRELNRLGYEDEYTYSKKFTLARIAKELRVSERTVGRWLRGESKPRKGQLIKIGKMLNRYYLDLNV